MNKNPTCLRWVIKVLDNNRTATSPSFWSWPWLEEVRKNSGVNCFDLMKRNNIRDKFYRDKRKRKK